MIRLKRDEGCPRVQEPEYLPPGPACAKDATGASFNGDPFHDGEDINRQPWRSDNEEANETECHLANRERIADAREDDGGIFAQHEVREIARRLGGR